MSNGLSMTSVNKIKELAEAHEYELAVGILDSQNLEKSLNPQFLRVCGEIYENVGRLKAEHPDIFYISMQNDFDACLEEGRKSCGTLFSTEPSAEDTPAKVVFTSGTTSFPKAVMLSVSNIFSGWRTLGRRVTLNEEDSCYLFLPLHHTYGSIYNFIIFFHAA